MKARVGQLCLLFYPQINLQNSSGFLVSVLLQMTFLSWGGCQVSVNRWCSANDWSSVHEAVWELWLCVWASWLWVSLYRVLGGSVVEGPPLSVSLVFPLGLKDFPVSSPEGKCLAAGVLRVRWQSVTGKGEAGSGAGWSWHSACTEHVVTPLFWGWHCLMSILYVVQPPTHPCLLLWSGRANPQWSGMVWGSWDSTASHMVSPALFLSIPLLHPQFQRYLVLPVPVPFESFMI